MVHTDFVGAEPASYKRVSVKKRQPMRLEYKAMSGSKELLIRMCCLIYWLASFAWWFG